MRLKYIDALRGLCIFLVLYWHVITYSGNGGCALGQFVMSFMLPMFFFISALVGYRSSDKLVDIKAVWKQINNKMLTLLVPTVLIYSFFQFCVGSSPTDFFFIGLYGYWFMLVLFEVYTFYYLLSYLLRRHSCIFDVIAVFAIIFSGFVGIYLASLYDVVPTICTVLNLSSFFIYLPFFLLGIMVRKYESTLLRLMTNDRVFAISVVLYAVFFLLNRTVITKEVSLVGYYLISAFVLRYLGLIMVFNVFYHSADFFNADGRISRILQFLGRRSLDLYLLHYFLLVDFQGINGGGMERSSIFFSISQWRACLPLLRC